MLVVILVLVLDSPPDHEDEDESANALDSIRARSKDARLAGPLRTQLPSL
jgi:hypothetical protein